MEDNFKNNSQNFNETEELSQDIPPHPPMGVIQCLLDIGNSLQDISEQAGAPDEKEKYFSDISEELNFHWEKINEMLQNLYNPPPMEEEYEISDEVMDFVEFVDKHFIEASELFLEAIEYYSDFIETEDIKILKEALEKIEKGAITLEKGEMAAKKMRQLITEGTSYGKA